MREEFIDFVRKLAVESAEVIKPYFAAFDLEVELKEDETPVTAADRGAEEVMRHLIRKEFPSHGVIGEEFGNENENAEFVWVLDPIDGTKSFTSGCPLFGTLICLLHERQPVLGAINQPILEQLCIGDNEQTTINGHPVHVPETNTISEAILLTTDILSIGKYQNRAGFDNLLHKAKMFRTWGDCYGYLLLASGGADIMLDPIVNPWDVLPVVPVVRGAGGVVTAWDGSDVVQGRLMCGCNPKSTPPCFGDLKR